MILCDACGCSGDEECHLGYRWAVSDRKLNEAGFNHLCGCCNHVYQKTKVYRGEDPGIEYLHGLKRLRENPVSV